MSGIRIIKRFAAPLLVLCAGVVASVTAASAQTTPGPVMELRNGNLSLNGSYVLPLIARGVGCSPEVNKLAELGITIVVDNTGVCVGRKDELEQTFTSLSSGPIWLYERKDIAYQSLEGLSVLLDWRAPTVFVSGQGALINCAINTSMPQFNAIRTAGSGRAIIATIGIGSPLGSDNRICVAPERVRNLFYVSLIAGAKGLELVTFNPLKTDVDYSVRPEVAEEVKRLSKQLGVLRPLLLSGKRAKFTLKHPVIRASAWTHKGATYVIAVNTSARRTSATFILPGRWNPNAQVMWENRKVRITTRKVKDNFAPLAVHVYKLLPKK